MDNFDSLRWLAEQGAKFALPYGRSKNKFEDGWPEKPHSLNEAIVHARRGGNVGVLTGEYSDGIVAIDRDVHFSETVEMLGDLGKTTKIIRDNAPERGKFLYRLDGAIPPSVVWKENPTDKHPSCEFLAKGRHALTDPSESEGGHYRLIDTDYGIQKITLVELEYIWRLITGGSIHKEQRAKEDAEQEKTNKDDFVRQVKEAWPVATVFEHFDRTTHGTAKDKGETRLLGNGGLLISTDGKQWYCHADSIGGDNLDAWAYCRWNKRVDRGNPKMFWDVVNDMAGVAGIARKIHTNGHSHKTATTNVEPPPASDDSYLLTEGAHDEGTALCIHQRYKASFLHSESMGWLCHRGTHWTMAEAESAAGRAATETLIARMSAAAKAGKDSETIKKFIPNSGRVRGAKAQLETLVSVEAESFDADPNLLNCKNGVVDLRTGVLVPHSTNQRFLHCASVAYRPNADQRPWCNWLAEAVGVEMAVWLQMAVGYSVTGHTTEEVMFYLYGPPRSGKGTFTETLLDMLGDPLGNVISFHVLTAPREVDSQNFALAPLHSSRFVAASESNAYERFNEAKVKLITGGDKIQVAFKHKTPFFYRPRYKIWLSSNQPVNADPDDEAVWGRIRVIEFLHSYLGKEDKGLKYDMRSPAILEGVLAWAVEGAMRWYTLGRQGLPELDRGKQIKAGHRAELDNVQAWIDEMCQRSDGFTAYASLYLSYQEWCKGRGVEPKKQKGFSQSLIMKGYQNKLAKLEGKMIRGFTGLRLS